MILKFVSERVSNLPPYLFSEFQKRKAVLIEQGVDVIDLGIGAPDIPTPDFVINRMMEESRKPQNHLYPPYHGHQEYREAVASFYQKHYGVELDPNTEVLTLIGSKEGIANLMHATVNPGEAVLVPNPGYPAYRTSVELVGGEVIDLPLDEEANYLPKFAEIDKASLAKVKLMLLNYPANPTAATVELATFAEAIQFAKENQLLVANDAAYDLVTFGDYEAPSIMQVPQAKDCAIEFGSLSKSFNMTGWRIGYVVGNKEVIKAIADLKSNLDSGQFLPIQFAAAKALTSDLSTVKENNLIYQERLEVLSEGLREVGIKAKKPNGTIFLWAEVPVGYTSMEFANLLLEKAGVIITPGSAFGTKGEGYFRIALTISKACFEEVINRLKQLKF